MEKFSLLTPGNGESFQNRCSSFGKDEVSDTVVRKDYEDLL